jgi:hypothetical protein
MITILAVGEAAAELAAFGSGHPSIEIVAASDAEDALDRLARNRRIDAVLLLSDASAPDTARLLREEDPGGPPVFAACAAPGVERIEAASPERMLLAVAERLSPEG